MSGTTSQNFNVVVRVLDQTTAPLRAIADKVGNVTKAIESGSRRIITSSQPLSQGALFGGLTSSAQTAAGAVGSLAGTLGGIVAPIAALGGLASLAGLTATLTAAAARAQTIVRAWQNIGATTEATRSLFEDMRYGAQQAGLEAGAAGSAMENLNRTIAGAARGQNQDAASLFARLGINLRDANGQIRSAVDLMPQLERAFARNSNSGVRGAMSSALFGSVDMGNVVAALPETRQRRRDRGLEGMSGDQATVLDSFRRSWTDLGKAIEEVQNAISARLAPILQPVVEGFTRWVTANKDWIATNFIGAIETMRDVLRDMPWDDIFRRWREFRTKLDEAVEYIGGARRAMQALAWVMAVPLVAAIGAATWAIGAFTASLLLNPITGSIALIGFAAYSLYRNWEEVKASLSAAWDMSHPRRFALFITDTLIPGVTWLATEGPGKVREAWEGLAGFFQGIGAAIGRSIDWVKERIDALVATMRSAVDALSRWGFSPDSQERHRRNWNDRTRGLYQPQSFSPGGGDGQVEMRIRFENAPAGMQVQTEAGGMVATPRVDVGYAFAGTSLARA